MPTSSDSKGLPDGYGGWLRLVFHPLELADQLGLFASKAPASGKIHVKAHVRKGPHGLETVAAHDREVKPRSVAGKLWDHVTQLEDEIGTLSEHGRRDLAKEQAWKDAHDTFHSLPADLKKEAMEPTSGPLAEHVPSAEEWQAQTKREHEALMAKRAAPAWPDKPKRGGKYADSSGEWSRAVRTIGDLPEVQAFKRDAIAWRAKMRAQLGAETYDGVFHTYSHNHGEDGPARMAERADEEEVQGAYMHFAHSAEPHTPATLTKWREERVQPAMEHRRKNMRLLEDPKLWDPETDFATVVGILRESSVGDRFAQRYLKAVRGIDWPTSSPDRANGVLGVHDLYYGTGDPNEALKKLDRYTFDRMAEAAEHRDNYIGGAARFTRLVDDHRAAGRQVSMGSLPRFLPAGAKLTHVGPHADGWQIELKNWVHGWNVFGPYTKSRENALPAFEAFMRRVAKIPKGVPESDWYRKTDAARREAVADVEKPLEKGTRFTVSAPIVQAMAKGMAGTLDIGNGGAARRSPPPTAPVSARATQKDRAGAVTSGELTSGTIRGRYVRQGMVGVLTLDGLTIDGLEAGLPFHMVVGTWAEAPRAMELAVRAFARGQIPDEGVFAPEGHERPRWGVTR